MARRPPVELISMSRTSTPDPSHHALAPHEVLLLLEVDEAQGLSATEATRRLGRYGPNVLPDAEPVAWWRRVFEQVNHPLIYVLLASGCITLVLGEYVDAVVILGVVAINATVGYLQEARAEAALAALQSMTRTRCRVRRDGSEHELASDQLVPGDVVLVEAGDRVPADLRLLSGRQLRTDESALTGESLPILKEQWALPDSTPVADRLNVLYSGTLVIAGGGTGVVIATGTRTEIGEIHQLVGSAVSLETPLTAKLAYFSRLLTYVILALAVVAFAVGVVRGETPADMFTAAVALAVGAIPEGLPAAVTITLAIGVARMARRRAVVRRLPAVETLGSTTVICSDKTGTLTRNQMTVRRIWTPDGTFTVTGTGYRLEGEVVDEHGRTTDLEHEQALRWTLLVGSLCNDAHLVTDEGDGQVLGDPTEGALIVAAAKGGLDPATLRADSELLDTVPFTSERQCMVTRHRSGTRTMTLMKGAVEVVVPRCQQQVDASGQLTVVEAPKVVAAATQMAAHGLRVLAVAFRVETDSEVPLTEDTDGLVLAGLVGMQDPPRPEAVVAVASCQDAGITVKMITGDHAATATAIAQEMGILGATPPPGSVLTGVDLQGLPPEDLPAAVEGAAVLARVTPEQKLRLVEGLQSSGHVVAMTGDGVNDAPSLKQADIGIAMGRLGTDVAKEAADMVLTDDDFATIEAAVEEGRGVFDNLTKFIVWTLPTNMGEGFVILVAIILGSSLPILPVQILWINMTTAVALGLMLAFEPKEPGIMHRPPRNPRQPLLTRALVERVLLVSALLVASAWWLFQWEVGNGAPLDAARTAALNLFVVVEIFYLFSCRTLRGSILEVGLFSNRWIWFGVVVQVAGQLALTYLPFMNAAFGTAPIGVEVWGRILLVGATAWAIVSLDKFVRLAWQRRRAATAG